MLTASLVIGAAGGGSAGFGGGGGGGGGHGGGFAIYLLFRLLFDIALLGHGLGALVIVALVLLVVFYVKVMPRAQTVWAEREHKARGKGLAERRRRVELAAAEAAEDEPAFAPDRVRTDAVTLFRSIQQAWTNGDRAALRRLVGGHLLGEWERRLEDFQSRGWRNVVEVVGEPGVEYVGLTHRGGSEDQVVVRIEATLRDYVIDAAGNHLTRRGRLSETVRIREFWTLGLHEGRWLLLSIEQRAEGLHAMKGEIVATPWSDRQGLFDEAMVEAAAADAVNTVDIGELAEVGFDDAAHAAALDASLVDGRFAPDILEITARRAVSAWAGAIDGDSGPLRELASPAVVSELLYPGDPSQATRVVVRGPSVQSIRIIAFDPQAKPPTMSVEVTIRGARYIENRATTAVVSGSPDRVSTFREHWTFALDGPDAQPWRIVSAGVPLIAR